MSDVGDLIRRVAALEAAANLRADRILSTASTAYTPEYYGGTTAGVTTYTKQQGFYVQVGTIVLCYGALTWTNATGTGEARISLPLTAAGDAGSYTWAPALRMSNVTYASSPFQGVLLGANNYFRLEYATSNAAATVIAVETDGSVIWTIVYEAA